MSDRWPARIGAMLGVRFGGKRQNEVSPRVDYALCCRRPFSSRLRKVIAQLVDKSAAADLRAIKQLTDIVQSAERRSEAGAAPSEPARLTAPDKEVIELFVARLRRQIAAEAAEAAAAAAT
jgi:hypothetical protein